MTYLLAMGYERISKSPAMWRGIDEDLSCAVNLLPHADKGEIMMMMVWLSCEVDLQPYAVMGLMMMIVVVWLNCEVNLQTLGHDTDDDDMAQPCSESTTTRGH